MTKSLPREKVNKVKKYLKSYAPLPTKVSERPEGYYSLRDIARFCNLSYYSVWCIWKGRRRERVKKVKREQVFTQYNPSGKFFDESFYSNWLTGERDYKTNAA